MVLEATDLRKSFRSKTGAVEAVRGVSLRAAEGEVLAFLGPNGAGKTTSIKMIAGLVRPDAGSVRIAGLDPHRDPWALRRVGAVLEGNRNLYWRLTPPENLEYFGAVRGLGRAEAGRRAGELLERFGLTDKAKVTVQTLSRGMQQKLAIAVALIHRPRLLLLDEPTLGLDVEAAIAVKGLVREIAAEGCAIVLTTHQLEVAEELSSRVTIIRQGRVVAEADTRDLIRRFSGEHYRIVVEGEPSPSQLERLARLGASAEGGKVAYTGQPGGLWDVLDVLRPLSVVRLEKDQADLTEVFLKLIRQDSGEDKEQGTPKEKTHA